MERNDKNVLPELPIAGEKNKEGKGNISYSMCGYAGDEVFGDNPEPRHE